MRGTVVVGLAWLVGCGSEVAEGWTGTWTLVDSTVIQNCGNGPARPYVGDVTFTHGAFGGPIETTLRQGEKGMFVCNMRWIVEDETTAELEVPLRCALGGSAGPVIAFSEGRLVRTDVIAWTAEGVAEVYFPTEPPRMCDRSERYTFARKAM